MQIIRARPRGMSLIIMIYRQRQEAVVGGGTNIDMSEKKKKK